MPYRDLREFLGKLEGEGEVARVTAPVDWNLEVGAVSLRAADLRAPAPLFQNITGYADRYSILANPIGPARDAPLGRLALAFGLPRQMPAKALIEEFRSRIKRRIPPVRIDSGPCKENIVRGAELDLLQFPAPFIHSGDGGRYLGLWQIDVTKDPETGSVNWGMYRHMVHDATSLGWLANPAAHATIHYQKWQARGEPMPIALAIGTEPVSSIVAATPFPPGSDDAAIAGAIRGEPVELVKCETIDLEVPASSEIVIEALVYPDERKLEGDFGEYTGYASGGRMPQPVLHVQCITYRSDPILTISIPSKGWHESTVIGAVALSGMILDELHSRGLPCAAAYVPPPTQCVIVAVPHQYAGVAHTIASALWSSKAGIYRPYIIAVDEDVDVTSMEDVFWCLMTRLHPGKGIHVQHHVPANPLFPFLWPEERQVRLSDRVLFDARFPDEWPPERRPALIDFEHGWPDEIQRQVIERWSEYGMESR